VNCRINRKWNSLTSVAYAQKATITTRNSSSMCGEYRTNVRAAVSKLVLPRDLGTR